MSFVASVSRFSTTVQLGKKFGIVSQWFSVICSSNTAIMSMEEPDVKRANLEANRKIGTHDGTFHCDEVLACFMLKQLPEYKEAVIVRSRNPETLKACDIVVDVGGIYDPVTHRYDHHQRTFHETMNSVDSSKPWVTKLSSAGLIYAHFGYRVLANLLAGSVDDTLVRKLYDKLYENFVEEVDAIDNGVSVSDATPRYFITSNLSARVGHLNPWWNDTSPNTEDRFYKALDLVGTEFLDRVNFYAKAWWPARELVQESIEKRHQVDSGGEIIELSKAGYPWKDHLFTLEEELQLKTTIKFVIFTDGSDNWRVQSVPKRLNSFELRIPLLKEWRGVRDSELESLSGIPGAIFVHGEGFIGGNKTREGALRMARETLQRVSADK